MGRRLNISQPTVINTELYPLNDHFELSANGETEQWYYVNTDDYSPDRETTPLIITPKITAVDNGTGTSYTPSFYQVLFYIKRYENGSWVETQVGTSATSNFPYYVSSNNLYVVGNNADAAHGVTVRCVASYIDPRDSGRTYKVEQTMNLTTNRDASTLYPTLDIQTASQLTYNPLVNSTSQFSLVASANWNNVVNGSTQSESAQFEWYGINDLGNEVLVDTLPFYVSGQHTNTLVVDAMYSENIVIVLRLRPDYHEVTLTPNKVYRRISWRISPIDGIIKCDNGDAVRKKGVTYKFGTIVNTNNEALSDDIIAKNLCFEWKLRPATPVADGSSVRPTDTVTTLGWGLTYGINTTQLVNATINGNASKLVFNNIYLLSAYKQVTYNGDTVTYNSNNVFGRDIEV